MTSGAIRPIADCDSIKAAIADLNRDIDYVQEDIENDPDPDMKGPLHREKRALKSQVAQLEREAHSLGCSD
jgi:hypothetical protein